MSKTVTIPNCMNPFVVMANGVKYTYPAGSTQEVPDEVAVVIEAHINAHNNPKIPTIEAPFKSASSWEDLGVIGMGDTLEWDIDLNAPYVHIEYGRAYKVSDNIITAEDLSNGAITTFVIPERGSSSQFECTFENGRIAQKDDGSIWIMGDYDGYDSNCVFCYPENSTYPSGVYFLATHYYGETFALKSLTIPNYGKFEKIKTIDFEYVPESLRFGKFPVANCSIVWDGNRDGLVGYEGGDQYYRVSDAIITREDLQGEVFMEYNNDGTQDTLVGISSLGDFEINAMGEYQDAISVTDQNGENTYLVWFVREGANTMPGVYFAKGAGYTVFGGENSMRPYSLTIPGCRKFNTNATKTIDKKFLPKAKALLDSVNDNVTGEEFNALLNALREAGYLAK